VALDSEYNGNDGFFMRRERALGAPTSITSECDNVELACRWLDTLYADPMVLNVRQYGMPGEDWEFDENGEVKLLYPEDGSPRDISAKGCGQIPLCHFQTVEQLTAGMEQYTWYAEQYQKMRECTWKSPTVKHIAMFTDEEQELMAYYNVDVKGVYGEYRAKFITGQLSVDADWDTYLNEIKKMGIDELTRAWQMIHDRTK
jgi:putative aldouronate transport system substrate-binding protein